MCAKAKDKVVGSWKSESIYLKTYGGDCSRGIKINEDGTWVCVGIRVSDDTYQLGDTLKNGSYEYKRLD